MKRIKYVIISFIMLFLFSNNVYALTGTVNVNDALYVRKTVGGEIDFYLYNNTVVTILSTSAGSTSTCSKWYKISYNGQEGYACGEFIVLNPETNSSNVTEDDSYNRNNYNNKPNGDGTIMCYEDTGSLSLRSTPGGSSVGKVDCGQVVTIESVSENGTNTNCDYYYKVKVGSSSGYVCGYFVNTTKLTPKAESYYSANGGLNSYYNTLKSKGFPDSYLPYLAEIHARHPNWVFDAEQIDFNFDNVVIGENGNGSSLLEQDYFADGYLSLNSNTFNVLNDTFSYYPNEGHFTNASQEAIAYYIDPRNYLNFKYIFAFEALSYAPSQTPEMVSTILSGQTFWGSLYSNGINGASSDIVTASSQIGISASHVAARIKQEVTGVSTSDSRLGGSFTYGGSSKSGYYNFFNIKSNCSNCSSIYAGYAYENGWNTPFKGIYGGAAFMYGSYISVNQDTLYYEKFDVSRNNSNFTHQYMQNLAAPVQEGGLKYKGYVNSLKSYLDTAITFIIPVYKNMPNYAVVAPNIGSPNNYLKDLKVNGSTVSGFNYGTYNYNVYLESNVTSVNIAATKINSSATISGTGTIPINSNDQTNTIVVKAGNGRTRNYTIHFTRKSSESVTVAEAMNNSGYKYNDNYIFGITPGTSITKLIANITAYNNSVTVSIKNSSGTTKTSGIFATGDVVNITGKDGTKTYTVLIYGDVSGDGKVTSLDYVKIRNYLTSTTNLKGVYFTAADVNKDGKITSLDYVKIRNHITGSSVISQ